MSSEDSHHFFSDAVNTTVLGGTFATIRGDAHFHSSTNRHGLKLLLLNIAHGAFHDASERGDPPRCHAHTRITILGEIMQWIKSPEAQRKYIIWLYGPAGAGKSAIAQSIAEACEKEGLLAASFFFSRTAAGRNNSTRFVATLAYQLTRTIPEIREHVFAAIEEDQTIFSRALATQMRVLVVEPLKEAARLKHPQHLLRHPAFAVVDGVDECGNPRSQTELLDVLGAAVEDLKDIPLILLVASRPEYEIRQAFNEDPFPSLMKGLVLDDNYKPDEDIKRYLQSTFLKIQQKYSALGCHLPSPWPAESDINRLVEKSSGQFIFSATVVKFVDSPRHDPSERLKIILGLANPGLKDTPFALLDTLYRFILSSVVDLPKVLEVLTLLMFSDSNSVYLKMGVVEELLGFDVRRTLIDMHALVFVPPPTGPHSRSILRMHHASMFDFLLDRSRSQEYSIDAKQGRIALSCYWLRMVGKYPGSELSRDHPFILCINAFIRHCKDLPASNEIQKELANFDLKVLFEQVEDLSELYTANWSEFFDCVQKQGGTRNDVFPRLQMEFDDFFLTRLSQYPPTLQSFIPIIFMLDGSYAQDIIHILFHAESSSGTEFRRLRKLDDGLLKMQALWILHGSAFADLFKDKRRAGRHHIDGDCYSALAKCIIEVLYPKAEDKGHQIEIVKIPNDTQRYLHDGSDPTARIALVYLRLAFVADVLSSASSDPSLAILLRDRVLQYKNDMALKNASKDIYQAALTYIKRCGITYLKHIHQPGTDKCLICKFCKDASVAENVEDVPNYFSPLIPPSLSLQNIVVSSPDILLQRPKKSIFRRMWPCLSSMHIEDT